MQHCTLLFRYIEFKKFGIEIHKDRENIVLVLRQPDKPTIRKTLETRPNGIDKRV